MKKGKILLLIIGLILLIGGISAYVMWNKDHQKAEDIAGIEVSIDELTTAFSIDETAANAKYLNKVIEVTGTISETENTQDGNLVVILTAADPMAGVQCTMREKGLDIKPGQKIAVKGFCTGSSLFGVLLTDCIIIK